MDVMLDLETMGTGPNAAIVAIAAVEFDAATNQLGDRYYNTVSLDSAIEEGGVVDGETVMWWLRQSSHARMELARDPISIRYALERFLKWLHGEPYVWGNGSDFDNVILRSAFERSGLPVPWSHKSNRCYRTLSSLYPDVPYTRHGVPHCALDDAKSQALHAMTILRMIGGK